MVKELSVECRYLSKYLYHSGGRSVWENLKHHLCDPANWKPIHPVVAKTPQDQFVDSLLDFDDREPSAVNTTHHQIPLDHYIVLSENIIIDNLSPLELPPSKFRCRYITSYGKTKAVLFESWHKTHEKNIDKAVRIVNKMCKENWFKEITKLRAEAWDFDASELNEWIEIHNEKYKAY